MTARCEVVKTPSGALAVRDRDVGQVMHPIVGPAVEAEQLYIAPSRLEARLEGGTSASPLLVLDVGLGAGSNAIAAWQVSERASASARRLEILSFDRDLEALVLATSDAHAAAFGFTGAAGQAVRALVADGLHETPRTRWRLVVGELPGALARAEARSADVVFWDPFSPRANPSLWTMGAFAALRRLCRDHATVHTYSAATAARSAMLLAGFAVGVGDAMREGWESTTAAVDLADLTRPLDRRWLARLGRSSAPFPPDAPPDAMARIAALPQFDDRGDRTP